MTQFRKLYIIALMVIVFSVQNSYARRKRIVLKREATNECRKAYLVARTTEKLCHMDVTSLDGYSSEVLEEMCSEDGCMKKTIEAYKEFDEQCEEGEVKNKEMLMQHINALDSIICKKNGKNYCLSNIYEFIHSNPKNKKDLGMCENNCISGIYNTIGKGVVNVPSFLRNDIIRANLLCSRVPGKKKYCIDKLEDFRNEDNYQKKMNIYCNSLCVQKVLWKEQSEYSLTYDLSSSPESIISNFTDSACLYHNENRCGEFLLKILNNDYSCSGLRYPRVFPFSGNYTICNQEINEIIDEYGTCVNSLFSNKSGDWLNLYTEISRYSKTRRLKNFNIFQEPSSCKFFFHFFIFFSFHIIIFFIILSIIY